MVYKYLLGDRIQPTKGLFHIVGKGRTRTNGWKLKPDKYILEIRYTFLSVRVIKHWNKLPMEEVDFPSFYVFKSRLDAFPEDTF